MVVIAAPAARAAPAVKQLRYHGYRLVVPAGWPVYRLSAAPTTCVRFDRNAVYLGHPSTAQRCPAHAAGRAEAILVQPLARAGRANAIGGSETTIADNAHGVLVTATWARHPAVIRRALRVRSLGSPPGAASAPAARWRPGAAPGPAARSQPGAAPRAATAAPARAQASARAAAAAAAGAVYTGLGFDPCSTPSTAAMAAWGSSPYRAVGVYLGGANMACSQPNLTPSWVVQESAAGWHLIPIYVGLQAPTNSCGCAAISPTLAASQGTAAASDAVARAQAVGLGPGNPIYFDMEAYSPTATNTTTALTFLSAWTAQLHAGGYASGVYSSADSGIRDLAGQYGSGYLEPDDIWVARWNEVRDTIEPNVAATEWAAHQRIHQYDGGHSETYSGVTINIDGDYVDGATAAAGSGSPPQPTIAAAPSLSVAAAADGSIVLRPSWAGFPGISSWQVVGGAAPTGLAPFTIPVRAASRAIVVRSAYAYFGVVALGSAGQALGSSAPVPTPAHVAIFGGSAFVPRRGPGGLPVGCFSATSCHVTTTISAGRTTLASTSPEYVPIGGGLTFFKLTSHGQAVLARARHHRLPVKVTVRDVSGASATRTLNLIPFATSGRSPRRAVHQSATMRIVGTSEFIRGRVGGVLAGCFASLPCHPSTTITASGKVIARATSEFLGVNELGYLFFSLTGTGRSILAHARGNQLSARLSISDGGRTATAQIVLSAFS